MKTTRIMQLTEKYIIDFLNALCFSNTIAWDGIDQFNELPILASVDDSDTKQEQRGGFLVHKKYPWAICVLVTLLEDSKQQVCYRLTSIKEKLQVDDPDKVCLPFDSLDVDFSVSDLNLGSSLSSSYSFCDNVGDQSSRICALLRFMLNSAFVSKNDPIQFGSVLTDVRSFPPMAGDIHYKPIFGVSDDNSGD